MNPALHRDSERFPTTRWTLLQQLEGQPHGSPGAQAALQQLRDLYWTPVLAAVEHVFPRSKYPGTDAVQLSQDFFVRLSHEVMPLIAQHSGASFRDRLKQLLLEFCRSKATELEVQDSQPAALAALAGRAARIHACGTALPADAADGMCPACLLRLALPSDELPRQIGDFEIVDQIGAGGMAVVYEAYDPNKRINVALKVMRRKTLLDESEVVLFRAGMCMAARLRRHPNIVHIEDAGGIRQDPPFFAMQLIEGGSLEDPANRHRFQAPEAAMRLMIQIARGVHSAHGDNVVHRDLKPGNVLVDTAGHPYVADFGVATLIRPGADDATGAVVGTLGYMSPEHVQGRANPQVDVYSLGAILYYLLTGGAPHRAESWQQLREQFENPHTARAVPPRRLAPAVSPDLEAVCMGALEPDPALRYRSAADFAAELQRVLDVKPLHLPRGTTPGVLRQLRYWCRRQPFQALGVGLGTLLLPLTVGAMMVQSLNSQALRITHTSQEYNVDLAAEKANRVLAKLQEDARKLTQAVREPSVHALFELLVTKSPAPELVASGSPTSDTMFVVDPQGYIKAHWPGPQDPGYFARDFSFRDYFRCALELHRKAIPGVCLSRVFEADPRINGRITMKFALSTNVYAVDGRWLGVFVATHDAAAELKEISITASYSGQITSLLGPQDLPSGSTLPHDTQPLTVVIHEQVESDRWYPIDAALSRTLQQRFARAAPGQHFAATDALPYRTDDYNDPVPGFRDAGLAGFAPVGRTGYVVAVYTPKSQALRALDQSKRTQLTWSLLLAGGVLLMISVWIARPRRQGEG